MSCLPCLSSHDNKGRKEHAIRSKGHKNSANRAGTKKKHKGSRKDKKKDKSASSCMRITAQNFTFRELASATNNFRQECLLREGGFGRVYKGTLQGSKQVVAIKQLNRNGVNEINQFMSEVSVLSCLCHENLVNLIGYCVDGDQRLLVYEYFPGDPIEDHVLDIGPDKEPLDWFARIKVAYGAAKGLEYLHDTASPPIIYRDLKSSNILVDEDCNAKLSDFGLANLGPPGDKLHVASRMMKTYGYCAPEYTRTGQLTSKSDVYSFGVVLLELITGRRAIDTTRPSEEQNLVTWAQRKFRNPKLFPDMADPLLERKFPEKDLNQAVAIAAMCLQEEASARPLMSDAVTALSYLSKASDVSGSLSPLLDSYPDFRIGSNSDGTTEHEAKLLQKEDSNSVRHSDPGTISIEEIANEDSTSDENISDVGANSSYKGIMSLDESDSSRSKCTSSISPEGSVSMLLGVPVEYDHQDGSLSGKSGRMLDEMSSENGRILGFESNSTSPRISQDSYNQRIFRWA